MIILSAEENVDGEEEKMREWLIKMGFNGKEGKARERYVCVCMSLCLYVRINVCVCQPEKER